ncbi:hypothetical protein EDD37DRAFT_653448 [Exophiala viscosa]|uniref:uncharacterized protein n=1 Tax=Exophiala viscosa TaxID=2486360 RepID=UPI002195DB6E|nr:hypothetical protein EDD37DRAFT_653448 [Exophiala viscosa]
MSSSNHQKPTLPKFEPLPPTNFINRLINRILAPFFYLLFSIVFSIIFVPIFVMIDNYKHGRGKNGGQRFATDESSKHYQSRPNKATSWMRSYGESYGQPSGRKAGGRG